MSEKDPKQTEADLSHSSGPSSSSLQPLQASLEQLLSEVIGSMQKSTEAVLKLHGLYLDKLEPVSDSMIKLHDLYLQLQPASDDQQKMLEQLHKKFGELRLESLNYAEAFRTHTVAIKELIAVVIESRQSVDAGRQKMDESNQALEKIRKDLTGPHPLISDEGPDAAPNVVHIVVHHVTNFTWKYRKGVTRTLVVIATGAWAWAAPHIYEAIKLFWRGS